jgi:CHAD domain-containing protein
MRSRQALDEDSTTTATSPHSVGRVSSHARRKRQPHHHSIPGLNALMTCGTAFRVIARGCLDDLTANHQAACQGDHAALHDMRIALTRLRAAIAFFSPMAVDAHSVRLKHELKWLNRHLGGARDIDVAIERLQATRTSQPQTRSDDRYWNQKSSATHRGLARTLRSIRYRRLIKNVSAWIDSGPWSTTAGKHAEKRRACPIARYGARKLTQWHKKLLKKARGLAAMDAKTRHRLRLANKRLRYSIEFFAGLLASENPAMHATLKHLRKAQQALGELNDAFNGRALLASLQLDTSRRGDLCQFLDPKREKQLLRLATLAYRKMDALRPLCI